MVLLLASSIARNVFAPPSSWLLRAQRRKNSVSASSPQSNASRSCFLLIGSSCHAVTIMTALATPERLPAVLRSAQADSPAEPEPASYPSRRAAHDPPPR